LAAGRQGLALQSAEDPTQESGVNVERGAKIGSLSTLLLGQFEENSRLGEAVTGLEETRPEQTDDLGPRPAEASEAIHDRPGGKVVDTVHYLPVDSVHYFG